MKLWMAKNSCVIFGMLNFMSDMLKTKVQLDDCIDLFGYLYKIMFSFLFILQNSNDSSTLTFILMLKHSDAKVQACMSLTH